MVPMQFSAFNRQTFDDGNCFELKEKNDKPKSDGKQFTYSFCSYVAKLELSVVTFPILWRLITTKSRPRKKPIVRYYVFHWFFYMLSIHVEIYGRR